MRITEYKILVSNDRDKLREEVNAHISEGWQPFGGVGVAIATDYLLSFAQSMVRYAASHS